MQDSKANDERTITGQQNAAEATPGTDTRTSADRTGGTPAVVAKRADESPVDTGEIRALAATAGYAVVGEVTQTGPERPGSYMGSGTVEGLAEAAGGTGARVVVVDDELAPGQHQHLVEATPAGTRVFDRYRLILEVFAGRAGTRRAALQVELARLRYELPRIRENTDEQAMNRRTESGTRYYQVRDRIDELQRKLDGLPDPGDQHRRQRREDGFDLVAVVGYTNAGKSTLLRRLADDLDSDAVDPDHPDEDVTVGVEDRLFETLETTTRKATVGGREVMLTDTVGFVADLPHRLVESFGGTLAESAAADAVVLVVDASDPLEDVREKLDVSLGVLDDRGVDRDGVVTACNKVDLLDDGERERRLAAVEDVAPNPVPVSVTDGENVDALVEALVDRLPTASATVEMPTSGDAMSVVSWAYDRLAVGTVDYDGDTVELVVEGRPALVDRLRERARAVRGPG